jgi:hypothetical protein
MKKICTKCEIEKPLNVNFFYATKVNTNGFTHWCKECYKNYRILNATQIKNSVQKCREKKSNQYKLIRKAWADANKDKKRMYALDYIAKKKLRKPKWFGELDALVMKEAHSLANIRKQIFGFNQLIKMFGNIL